MQFAGAGHEIDVGTALAAVGSPSCTADQLAPVQVSMKTPLEPPLESTPTAVQSVASAQAIARGWPWVQPAGVGRLTDVHDEPSKRSATFVERAGPFWEYPTSQHVVVVGQARPVSVSGDAGVDAGLARIDGCHAGGVAAGEADGASTATTAIAAASTVSRPGRSCRCGWCGAHRIIDSFP
jgi:hypothetical protein